MTQPRMSAAMIVRRGSGDDAEILLVRRAASMRFFGGYWAFPGGAVEPLDRSFDPSDRRRATACCAVRELLEEAGLVARGLDIEVAAGRALVARLKEADGAVRWRALLEASPAALAAVRPVCAITTPLFSPIRFATDFVEVDVDEHQIPMFDPGEVEHGEFVKPREAVARWQRGEWLIAPPALLLLELMATHGVEAYQPVAAALARGFEAGEFHPARFSPGIFVAPLPSPTLPPATTTNCYIVGRDTLYVIDPAALDAPTRDRLRREIATRIAQGARFAAVLLTHHHRDHVGAAALLSREFGAPLRAHELTYSRLPDTDYVRGAPLRDGDRLPLGVAPDGSADWHLEVLHTPGHARDHLCYIDSRYRAAVVGDMLSTVSTIVIDPPEGHMATYLTSLERLLAVPMTTLYPAHGTPFRDGHTLIRHYLGHRRQREGRIRDALTDAPQTIEALLPQAYGDVTPDAHAPALRSLLAGLQKLEEEGAARSSAAGWMRAWRPV